MMTTPICDFVEKYAKRPVIRLHMPGHKGVPLLGAEPFDITEVDGADVLYSSDGIIRESENNAARLFGAGRTVYSTEGSSLSIRAMLYLAVLYARENGRKPIIAAGRNAHKAFLTSAVLLDFDIVWLYSKTSDSMISCDITPDALDEMLRGVAELPCAVYITSPNYLGDRADIEGIARVCHRYGVLLLVDNAHGAYLAFLEESQHPMRLGADMCTDSAHKTLPVLTGGAYLHISKNAPVIFSENCERAMSLFASTSPSYLILQSLDAANKYLAGGYSERLFATVQRLEKLKTLLLGHGYSLIGDEPTKLTIAPKPLGYTGCEIVGILSAHGIVCEFSDPDYCVMMFTPELERAAYTRISDVLLSITPRKPISVLPPKPTASRRVMSPREAMLSPSRTVSVQDAVGAVMADINVACPPAIPIVMCGERISADTLRVFEYYNVTNVRVVK